MRLIDADALIETFNQYEDRKGNLIADWNVLIDNAPTVETYCSYLSDNEVKQPCLEGPCSGQIVPDTLQGWRYEERPKGKWNLYGMIYYCSECGHDCGESGDNYCGNCGADMRGGAS